MTQHQRSRSRNYLVVPPPGAKTFRSTGLSVYPYTASALSELVGPNYGFGYGNYNQSCRMDDYIGNRSGFNPVTNTKMNQTKFSQSVVGSKSSGITSVRMPGGNVLCDSVTTDHLCYSVGSMLDYQYNLSSLPVVAQTSIDASLANTLNKCLPSASPNLNLLNSLRELVDVRDLFQSAILSGVRRSVRISKNQRKLFTTKAKRKGYTKKQIKDYLKGISSDYLAVSFGWLPLVGDIKAAFSSHREVERIYRRLRTNKNTVFRKRCVRTIPVSESWTSRNDSASTYNWNNTVDLLVKQYVRTATMLKYRLRLPDLSVQSELEMLRSKLGLHCIAGTLWEAVPFSFVVDWFIPVGNLFEKADSVLEMSCPYEILEISQTVDIRSTVEGYPRTNMGSNFPIPPKSVLAASKTSSKFIRTGSRDPVVTSSYSPAFALGTGLNGKRCSYLAAMVLQRI